MKKPAGSFRFRFYNRKNQTETEKKPEKKTEPKPSQIGKTEPNRFEPVFALKNRTETGRFDPVSVRFRFFFQKKFGLVTFFDKNRTEPNRK